MDHLTKEASNPSPQRRTLATRANFEIDSKQRGLNPHEQQCRDREDRLKRRRQARIQAREGAEVSEQEEDRPSRKKLELPAHLAKSSGEARGHTKLSQRRTKVAAKKPTKDLSEADLNDPIPFNSQDYIEKALEYEAREAHGELEVRWKEHPYTVEVSRLTYLDKAKIVFTWCKIMLTEIEAASSQEHQLTLKEIKDAVSRLFKLIRSRKLQDQIISRIVLIVRHCQIKSYLRAHNHYLELAISEERDWDTEQTLRMFHLESVNEETRRRITLTLKRMLMLYQKLHPADSPKSLD